MSAPVGDSCASWDAPSLVQVVLIRIGLEMLGELGVLLFV